MSQNLTPKPCWIKTLSDIINSQVQQSLNPKVSIAYSANFFGGPTSGTITDLRCSVPAGSEVPVNSSDWVSSPPSGVPARSRCCRCRYLRLWSHRPRPRVESPRPSPLKRQPKRRRRRSTCRGRHPLYRKQMISEFSSFDLFFRVVRRDPLPGKSILMMTHHFISSHYG